MAFPLGITNEHIVVRAVIDRHRHSEQIIERRVKDAVPYGQRCTVGATLGGKRATPRNDEVFLSPAVTGE